MDILPEFIVVWYTTDLLCTKQWKYIYGANSVSVLNVAFFVTYSVEMIFNRKFHTLIQASIYKLVMWICHEIKGLLTYTEKHHYWYMKFRETTMKEFY